MTQKQIIVDSSVAVKWVSSENELHVEKADLLLKMIERSGAELIMPELGKYEVGNALLYKKTLLLHLIHYLIIFTIFRFDL